MNEPAAEACFVTHSQKAYLLRGTEFDIVLNIVKQRAAVFCWILQGAELGEG